jgi:hypothetical protein
VTFGAWAVGTTYARSDVVTGSDGQIYISNVATNLAHDPTSDLVNWSFYFGPDAAAEYVMLWSATITYAVGDHSVGSDGTIYVSLVAANLNHNPVGDLGVHWGVAANQSPTDLTAADTTNYFAGEIVWRGNKVYISLQNSNSDDPGAASWLLMTTAAAVADPNFIYPIGSGPQSQAATRNVYRLPVNYLREAPQQPKAGSQLWLGSPTGLTYDDWEFEGNYFVTSQFDAIVFRFVADIVDPAQFDALFIEGFGCRIALEVCEPLTQSTTKLQAIAQEYKQFMTEARLVNGIETGPTEPPEDAYITAQR